MTKILFDRWPDKADGQYTVWYYGGLRCWLGDNAVPDVDIWLRDESARGSFAKFIGWQIPLTHAALLPVGSKVSQGVLHERPLWRSEVFTVRFDETPRLDQGGWQYRCWSHWLGSGRKDPFGAGGYALPPRASQSWWLEFGLEGGRTLLVPCMEFLLRGYLRDKETLRKILLYRGADRDQRLFGVTDPPQSDAPWKVPLAHGIRNDDVVFLAHLRHDPYTQGSVGELVSQMDQECSKPMPEPALLKTRPWFRAKSVKVRVRGLWVGGGDTFLCLNLMGCSKPDGPAIEAEREEAEKVAAGEPSDNDVQRLPRRVVTIPANTVDLISHVAPGSTMPTLQIEEEPFETLDTGKRRPVQIARRVRAGRKSATSRVDPKDLHGFSTGVPGSNTTHGRASPHAPAHQDSLGMLDDMWRSFVLLSEKGDNFVRAVEAMDREGSFHAVDDPQPYIGLLSEQDMSKGKFKSNRRWALIDPGANPARPRAVMFVRLVTAKGAAYFVELERRVSASVSEDSTSSKSPVSEVNQFCGLAFTLHTGHDLPFMEIATFILDEIVKHRGVMKDVGKALAGYPNAGIPIVQRHLVFKHRDRDEKSLYSGLIKGYVLGELFSATPPPPTVSP